ncbi:MAG: flagellar protein export ATPase FliI [Alphaproteobacteria bacterium]
MPSTLKSLLHEVDQIKNLHLYGVVTSVEGLRITTKLQSKKVVLGQKCFLALPDGRLLPAEVAGFKNDDIFIILFGEQKGIHSGCRVFFSKEPDFIYPDISWMGRVINAFCEPIDGKGGLTKGPSKHSIHAVPLSAHKRAKIETPIDVGVRSINTFLTVCKGQRMGIFAGSGIGKSTLLSMLTKFTKCDVCVVGLIGERGREAKEFIEDTLKEEGLQKSIIIVATSDEPILTRKQAAFLTLSLAEYFRDQGLNVLCLFDSVTRFAVAQRELGLTVGEPPTTRGYTPSVFTELPKLLERAGPGERIEGKKTGYITAFFTVLVDGDDHNEPITDAVRATIDGHIVLDRDLAERAHFPAINILRSVSRLVPKCHTEEQTNIIQNARRLLSVYEDMKDMIRLGIYKKGSNQEVDQAIEYYSKLSSFLVQRQDEHTSLEDSFSRLKDITAPYITVANDKFSAS